MGYWLTQREENRFLWCLYALAFSGFLGRQIRVSFVEGREVLGEMAVWRGSEEWPAIEPSRSGNSANCRKAMIDHILWGLYKNFRLFRSEPVKSRALSTMLK
jgi:hypothetical protein